MFRTNKCFVCCCCVVMIGKRCVLFQVCKHESVYGLKLRELEIIDSRYFDTEVREAKSSDFQCQKKERTKL